MHPSVLEAAVFGYPDEELGEIVVAVVELQKSTALTQKELNEFIGKYIPKFKHPKSILFFNKLPRTFSDKVNKSKLITKFASILNSLET